MNVGELIGALREFDEWSPAVFIGPPVAASIPVEVESVEAAYLPIDGLVGRTRCCVVKVGKAEDRTAWPLPDPPRSI